MCVLCNRTLSPTKQSSIRRRFASYLWSMMIKGKGGSAMIIPQVGVTLSRIWCSTRHHRSGCHNAPLTSNHGNLGSSLRSWTGQINQFYPKEYLTKLILELHDASSEIDLRVDLVYSCDRTVTFFVLKFVSLSVAICALVFHILKLQTIKVTWDYFLKACINCHLCFKTILAFTQHEQTTSARKVLSMRK